MSQDEDGFLFPEKTAEKCINCSKCFNVCPFENKCEPEIKNQEYYALKSKEKDVRFLSSSGGAFSVIAESFCDENYVLFGAVFDENLKVKHSFTQDISDLSKFRKSKYVQSDIGDSFIKAKQFLTEGKKVLFTGTPCQIAGLRNFLGKDYDNLLCVDLVCHGVPSQALFDKYISELSDELGDKVTEFTFRNKHNFDKKNCNLKTVKIKTQGGKETVKQVLECEYLAGYHEKLFYRESCEVCPYANTDRTGDITIGDFWGIEKIEPSFDDGNGVSLVIANNDKGRNIVSLIGDKAELLISDREQAVKRNDNLVHPAKPHENREKFLNCNRNNTFCQSVRNSMFIPSPLRLKVSNLASPVKKMIRKFR